MYSRKEALIRCLACKQRRGKKQAKQQNKKSEPKDINDMSIKHPDELREANQKNFTKQIIRISKEFDTYMDKVIKRRSKLIV